MGNYKDLRGAYPPLRPPKPKKTPLFTPKNISHTIVYVITLCEMWQQKPSHLPRLVVCV